LSVNERPFEIQIDYSNEIFIQDEITNNKIEIGEDLSDYLD